MSDRSVASDRRWDAVREPLSASVVASGALAVVAVVVLGNDVGYLQPVGLGVGAGATFAAAGLLANREEPIAVAAGSLAFVFAAGLLFAAGRIVAGSIVAEIDATITMAEFVADTWQALALVAAGCAVGYGVVLAGRPDDSRSALSGAFGLAAVVGIVLAVALVATVTGRFLEGTEPVTRLVDGLSPVRDGVLAPSTDPPPIGSFLIVTAVAAFALRALAGRLPLVELVARDRRDAVRRRIERERSRALRVAGVAGAIGIGLAVLPESVWQSISASAPTVVVETLGGITAAGWLRLALVWLTGLSVAGVATVALLERFRRETAERLVGWLAYGAGGVAILVGLDRVPLAEYAADLIAILPQEDADTAIELIDQVGIAELALGAVTVVVLTIGLLTLFGVGVHALGVVPSATAGPTIAALGVGLAAVVSGLIAGPSLWTFLAVGAAVVVWDVGAYGHRLRAELGPTAPTRSVELLHLSLAATIATIAGLSAHYLADVVHPGVELSAAAIFALVGAVCLLAALRG